jgi:hypothetical protein
MDDRHSEALLKASRRLFPGVAQLVQDCWSKPRAADQLIPNTYGTDTTAVDEAAVVKDWLALRDGPTARYELQRLKFELDWISANLR